MARCPCTLAWRRPTVSSSMLAGSIIQIADCRFSPPVHAAVSGHTAYIAGMRPLVGRVPDPARASKSCEPRRAEIYNPKSAICNWQCGSCRNLFLGREIRAALGAWEKLVRIAAAFRVEDTPQGTHRIEVVLRELLFHEINFLGADAVLACHAPAELDALQQNIVPGLQRAAHLVGVSFIVKDERVDIAVAGVENVWDAQAVFLAAGADELHDLRQAGARNHAVLCEKIRAEPANGAEGPLPGLPEVGPFLVAPSHTHLAGAVLGANFFDAIDLPVEPRFEAIEFDDQNGPGIERKTKMVGGLDSLGDELVHHFQRRRHDARRDDVTDRLARILDTLEDTEHSFESARRANQAQKDAGDDSEHALGANDRATQIVTIHLLTAVGPGAEPDDLAIGQDHFEAEDVIGRHRSEE